MGKPLLTQNEFRFVSEAFDQLEEDDFDTDFWKVDEITVPHKLIKFINLHGGSFFYFGRISDFGNDRVFYKNSKLNIYTCADSIQ